MNYPKTLVNSLSKIDKEFVRFKSSRSSELFSEQFEKWEFNVYDVADASKQRPLTYVLYELLKKYDLLTTFKVRFPATSMLLIYIGAFLSC